MAAKRRQRRPVRPAAARYQCGNCKRLLLGDRLDTHGQVQVSNGEGRHDCRWYGRRMPQRCGRRICDDYFCQCKLGRAPK